MELAKNAAKDPDLKEFHIVSGLHPKWPFEFYVDIIKSIKEQLPQVHLKAFTGVEIAVANISGKSIEEVLRRVNCCRCPINAGGGAENFIG